MTYSNVAFTVCSMHIAYKEYLVLAFIAIGYQLGKVKTSFLSRVSKFREKKITCYDVMLHKIHRRNF